MSIATWGKYSVRLLTYDYKTFSKPTKSWRKVKLDICPNRTSDHIYTLHTIIDKHVHQNKTKIFACFIDFEKAFDSIWHEGLFLKLLENGIGGKTFDLISTMYKNNTCAVKIGNKRTEFFSQRRGVRQGCPLSPTLFNIYINELAKELNNSTAPGPTLTESEIKCLLFADDLVILSKTKEGLQQLLDIIETFSQTWALKINLTKTKIMIFQKRPRCKENKYTFRAGNQVLVHLSGTKNQLNGKLQSGCECTESKGTESLLHDQKYNSVRNSNSNLAKNPKSNNRTNCTIWQ